MEAAQNVPDECTTLYSLFPAPVPRPSMYNSSLSSSLCQGAGREMTGCRYCSKRSFNLLEGFDVGIRDAASLRFAWSTSGVRKMRFPLDLRMQLSLNRGGIASVGRPFCFLLSAYCLPLPAAPTFFNSAPVVASTSACSEFPCESMVTMAGKSFASKTHIASGTPSSSSR